MCQGLVLGLGDKGLGLILKRGNMGDLVASVEEAGEEASAWESRKDRRTALEESWSGQPGGEDVGHS